MEPEPEAEKPAPIILEGKLVEIFGLEESLSPSPETLASAPDAEAVNANGERGRVVGYSEAEQKHIVETFEGTIVGIPEANLRVFQPASPEDGGFDVAWPGGSFSQDVFAEVVAVNLLQKGYCMVQMFTPPHVRDKALEEAMDLRQWNLPKKELEESFLGSANSTKYANLEPDDIQTDVDEGDALWMCDRTLSNLGVVMSPLAPGYFGFEMWGRQNGMVRIPLADSEEESLRPEPLGTNDYDPGGSAYGHINFLERRRLFGMYLIENTGGELILQPRADINLPRVEIPLSRNKLLVMLPELFTYSYNPRGESLVLQTWYVCAPYASDPEDSCIVSLPPLLDGERAHVTALRFRFGANAHGPTEGWSAWTTGADGAVKVPHSRWDIDAYWSPDKDSIKPLYTCHTSAVNEHVIQAFDHEFFGISLHEANGMAPSQRNCLEVGYETLSSAGFTWETCKGQHIGTFLGDASTDWSFQQCAMMREEAARGVMHPERKCGISNGILASRLAHVLDLKGPMISCDTACSSSLCAFGQANKAMATKQVGQKRALTNTGCARSVVMGICIDDGPFTFMAYCGANMLSVGGRSFTFDESANGFLRGEGCGSSFIERSDSEGAAQKMLACIFGTNVNQDGRSASMTAPNGPSQQQCIKASMREGGLKPSQITIAECHGTGTALGDPIEVSALRDVMKDRGEDAIIMTSAKANYGHMEASAGSGGIAKCVLMLVTMTGAANIHLRHLNPHIESNGYPAFFVDDLVDCKCKTGIAGVSSFGVGGTNARADLWGRARLGQHLTTEVLTQERMQLRSVFYMRVKEHGTPGPMLADSVYITGSWNAWSTMESMDNIAEGEYAITIAIGDTLSERFRIVLNENPNQTIYPTVDGAGSDGEAQGPDWKVGDKAWLLDGRADKSSTGAIYRIKFKWDFDWSIGERQKITWERLDDEEDEPPRIDGKSFEHTYLVCGSWTAFRRQPMKPVQGQPGLYEARVRIGVTGSEEFHFLRDGDAKQAIHPAIADARKSTIPVRGPDNDGTGKYWVVEAATGEHVNLLLFVAGGELEVKAISQRYGVKTWSSKEIEDWHDYYVLGSWSDGKLGQMERVATGVHKCRMTIGETGFEEFQLVVDQDPDLTLYPHESDAALGRGSLCGPDGNGDGLYWMISGRPGQKYEITLDWNEEDWYRVVSWSLWCQPAEPLEPLATVASEEPLEPLG